MIPSCYRVEARLVLVVLLMMQKSLQHNLWQSNQICNTRKSAAGYCREHAKLAGNMPNQTNACPPGQNPHIQSRACTVPLNTIALNSCNAIIGNTPGHDKGGG